MSATQYTCPKCSKTVSFEDVSSKLRRRHCPHCGREIMEWDGKPDRQQHSGAPKLVPPRIILLVVLVVLLGAVAYFVMMR